MHLRVCSEVTRNEYVPDKVPDIALGGATSMMGREIKQEGGAPGATLVATAAPIISRRLHT